MTEDHFPPSSTELPVDSIMPESEYCGECDRHVVSDHDHRVNCSNWRGTQ